MASERIRTLLVEQFLTIHRAVTLFGRLLVAHYQLSVGSRGGRLPTNTGL